MNRFVRLTYFIWLAILVLAEFAIAAGPVVLGLRGDEAALNAYSKSKGRAIVASETVDFESGNTFVRIQDRLAYQNVEILLPAELTPNQLMEALIKIRTAKTEGAASITLVSPQEVPPRMVGSDSTTTVDLPKLFGLSGATGPKDWIKSSTKLRQARATVSPGLLYTRTHPVLTQELGQFTGLKSVEGLAQLKAQATQRKAPVYYVLSANGAGSNEQLLIALSEIQELSSAGVQVHLVTPYLPYARSDKIDQAGVTVIGRLVADLIEGSGTKAITFMRAHATQSQGFFSIPSTQLSGRPTLTRYLKSLGVQIVVAPDAGFQKDATLYADEMDLPLAIVNKFRDPLTSQTAMKGISGDSVAGKIAVVIDDETASGGTLGKVAKLLKEQGAKAVFASVTHLTGTARAAVESPDLAEVIVTNTLALPEGSRFKTLSIASELGEHLLQLEQARGCASALLPD